MTDPFVCEGLNCCWNQSVTASSCFSIRISYEQSLAMNARAQVTTWAPMSSPSGLSEYAYDCRVAALLTLHRYKLWNGLVGDYYLPRWTMWFDAVSQSMTGGLAFNETTFMAGLQGWEEEWVHRVENPYSTSPSGDAFGLASAIYTKYFGPLPQ